MSKTNEIFIKTLLVCGKLDIINKDILNDVIDVISSSDADIVYHYNYIKKLYERDSNSFGEILGILLPAYTVIKYKQRYFEDYTKLVSLRLKISTYKELKYIIMFFGHNKRFLNITRDLRLWKIQEIKGLERLKINNKIVTLGLTKNENEVYIQQLDSAGIVQNEFSAIEIKNDDIKIIKEDNLKMMDIILKDDYNLIIIPSMNLMKENIWKNYNTSQMTNEDSLEYAIICNQFSIGKEEIENEYENICNSKYNLKKLLRLMVKWKALNTNYIIIFISNILDKIQYLDEENAKSILEQVYKTMYIRINDVKYTELNMAHKVLIKYWISLFRNRDLSIEDCMNSFKIDRGDHIYAVKDLNDVIYNIFESNRVKVMDHMTCKDTIENAVIVIENNGRKTVLDRVKQKDLYTNILKKNNIDLIIDTQWEEL